MGFKIEFKGRHLTSIVVALFLILLDVFLFAGSFVFLAFIFLALAIAVLPFLIDYFAYNQKQKDIEERFPDFVRNLVNAVKSGMPISRGIVYVSRSDYGPLNYYVKKMANQIEWNIPVKKVFQTFGNEVGNPIIKRAVSTVLEAEESGGNIEDVLGSITESLLTIKRLKQERKASIQGQITQSYVIFFIFIGVLLTIQNVLIPYLSEMETPESGFGGGDSEALANLRTAHKFDYSSVGSFLGSFFKWFGSLSGIFMMLALIQSFFAGIVLGKMSEGDYKSGLRHSLFMMFIAIFVLTIANSLLSQAIG
ncbi:MAG: type II secretion system F family protein [Nanoarchaeota archaeon]